MDAHGYRNTTFRFETDAQGEPLVHRVNGHHPDSHYLDDTRVVYGEIEQIFDLQENIYLVVVDHSIDAIGTGGGRIAGGTGGGYKKRGSALVPASVPFKTVAHELGHAYGLAHDFRDGAYIMSYGPGRVQLSACAAEFLEVHPYFNPESSLDSEGDRFADRRAPFTAGLSGRHKKCPHPAQARGFGRASPGDPVRRDEGYRLYCGRFGNQGMPEVVGREREGHRIRV